MFRMIFATISAIFNMLRISAEAGNRLVMIAHVRSSQLLLEELQASGDLESLESQLRTLGLTEISELPKAQPRPTTTRAAKA